MERTHKQITGRSPAPYSWDEHRYDAARARNRDSNAFRIENFAEQKKRKRNERTKLVILEILTIAVLVMMLSMVIGKLNHISRIKKEHTKLAETLTVLEADITIKTTHLQGRISDQSISHMASTKLGMYMPDEDTAQVLSNVKRNTPAETHAAAGFRP